MEKDIATITYGIVVTDPCRTLNGKQWVVHFSGYWDVPTVHDFNGLLKEMIEDEDFGVGEVATRFEYKLADPDLVKIIAEGDWVEWI